MRVETVNVASGLAEVTAGQAGAAGATKSLRRVKPDAIALKFGSSVLRRIEDLPGVVSEIYRYARHGKGIVAVVSAFAGETDRLVAEAERFGAATSSRHAPRLIALGEDRAAALLAMACDQAGLDARIMGARQLQLMAAGPVTDAHPESIDAKVLNAAVDAHDVVIVPGFVALSHEHEPVLLGRGGSDLTAVVVADALGLNEVTLAKDVDGVYDRDPNSASDAKRYEFLTWEDARQVAGKLLQPKAIGFAAARGIYIRVAQLGSEKSSLVGVKSAPPKPTTSNKRLRVGLAGLGVVGEGLALRLLAEPQRYELVSVLVSNAEKERHRQINPGIITTSESTFLNAGADVIVDALSCADAGGRLTAAARASGVAVVSANKQAIVSAIAGANNGLPNCAYAAAVGGGAPMIETARRAREEGDVVVINAVLNGTVNYILSSLDKGATFEESLKAAQAAGFAEADPSADLSGEDARAKIGILAWEAFGRLPTKLDIEALDAEKARGFLESGGVWRQLATLTHEGEELVGRVRYAQVDNDPLFSSLDGEGNALQIRLSNGRILVAKGRGAGRVPTVESLFADLAEIRRSRA